MDIWGDGMSRGNREVTRMCFRLLGKGLKRFKHCQSRTGTFCFAVFIGKDGRNNLEMNLGSFDVVGNRGWLYEETKTIVCVHKAKITLSGDAPFQSRLVYDRCEDKTCISQMSCWAPDIPEVELQQLLRKHKLKKKDLHEQLPPEIQADLIENKVYSATTTYYDWKTFVVPKNVRPEDFIRIVVPGEDGYRTQIPLNMDIALPPQSLIYVENMCYVVPDGCHMTVRIVEKDLKLMAEYLLSVQRLEHFKRFEANICSRDIKNQRFRFSSKDGNAIHTSCEIGDVSLCGRDARAIIAEPEELEGTNVCQLFEGVLLQELPVPNHRPRSVQILEDELKVITRPESFSTTDSTRPSELAIGTLLFRSLNNITK